jgi:queuine tRNA-ribosyltransferase
MSRLNFRLEADASLTGATRARAGRFRTLHGEVLTPLFMPVGTQGTVRNLSSQFLDSSGSQILLANTYHLLLRPGLEDMEKLGGLHKLMNWSGSILTDSGGFQIFSLPGSREMKEEGAVFTSYVDGAVYHLDPELSIRMQEAIGSDIRMVLDECVPSTVDHATAKAAMERTHRWAKRSLDARTALEAKRPERAGSSMFAIVQGACHEDLRKESARVLTQMPFDGFAVGGLAVGETREEREEFTGIVTAFLPPDRPRYLMGVGTPIDLLEAVHRGIDMFDCVIPTKLSEQGVAYTSRGRLQLGRGAFRFADEPLDSECDCHTCRTHSKAYLHHLVKTSEPLLTQLVGAHNVRFYHRLMSKMRAAILDGTFLELYRAQRDILHAGDPAFPVVPPRKTRRPVRRPEELGIFSIVWPKKPSREGGCGSLRHSGTGEIMHPGEDPMTEARGLYVDQSKLAERIGDGGSEPLVLWDVGLGAGFNAMAALESAMETHAKLAPEQRRPLHVVSFERDLDAIRLALFYPDLFRHLRHAAPHALLESGEWTHKELPIRWTLLEGDFLQTMDRAPAPDLVFFDPFSQKTDGPLWSEDTFRRVHARTGGKACRLFTYSRSSAVRMNMKAAGFHIARGQATGPKEETTVALTAAAAGEYPAVDPSRL